MSYPLIVLSLSGKNDSILVDNPNFSYFKKVYKKNSNFYINTIKQNFKQDFNFDKVLSCELSKNGDLLNKLYLNIKINEINKYIDKNTLTENKYARFAWKKKLGFALINKINIDIGGNIISTLYSDWLNIWNELTGNNNYEISNLNELIGNKSELYNFSETKKEIELFIPIPFWFSNPNLSLPLCAIKNHNIIINILINEKKNICTYGPDKSLEINENIIYLQENELIEQIIDGRRNIGLFLNFDNINNRINYITIKNNFEIPTSKESNYKITGLSSNFSVTPKVNSVLINNDIEYDFTIEYINLISDYILLDNEEKTYFEENTHYYLIDNIQSNYIDTVINKSITTKLNFYNLCKELFWICKLKYNKILDIFNYSIEIDNEYLITRSNLLFDNIKLIDNFDDTILFNKIIPYYYHSKVPYNGINCYPFCLNSEIIQPNGSINLNMVNNLSLELNFDLHNFLMNEEIEIIVYNLSYNFLKIDKNNVSILLKK